MFGWWAEQGSNLRPRPCKGRALPLSYPPVVPEVGVEPTRACAHRILSPARLPVPPLRRADFLRVPATAATVDRPPPRGVKWCHPSPPPPGFLPPRRCGPVAGPATRPPALGGGGAPPEYPPGGHQGNPARKLGLTQFDPVSGPPGRAWSRVPSGVLRPVLADAMRREAQGTGPGVAGRSRPTTVPSGSSEPPATSCNTHQDPSSTQRTTRANSSLDTRRHHTRVRTAHLQTVDPTLILTSRLPKLQLTS
jgi:hypothetical protein